MKKNLLTVLIASLGCAPLAAMAVDSYVGFNLGSTQAKLRADSGASSSDNAIGAKLYGGFQFNDIVGLELGYASLGSQSINGFGFTGTVKPEPIYLTMTGTWNINEKFAAFGKLGAVRSRAKFAGISTSTAAGVLQDGRESTTTNLFALGASYTINARLAAVVEFENYGDLVKDYPGSLRTRMLSAGLRFNF